MRGEDGLRIALVAVLAAACSIAPGCSQSLTPFGQALVVVDTDLPAPTVIDHLRIDAYTQDAGWFQSLDYALPDARSWPVSFGLTAPDPGDRDVLLRLRAYQGAYVRTYLGERYQPPVKFQEPFVAHDLTSLCANPPELLLGGTVTVRRGRDPFLTRFEGCVPPVGNAVGSAAVHVEIPAHGTYCFGALSTYPSYDAGPSKPAYHQVTLQLRSGCSDAATALACEDGVPFFDSTDYVLPRISLTLDKGPYTLLVGGAFVWQAPTDVVLGAAASSCDALAAPPSPVVPDIPATPIELHGDPAATPPLEPLPSMAVDRLVRLPLRSGVVGQVEVVLGGDCAGVMSKLGDGGIDFESATTCLDPDHPTAPVPVVVPTANPGAAKPSRRGTYAPAAPCPDAAPAPGAICVPGGSFVLGSYGTDSTSMPARIAAVSSFWMDGEEVTVGRLRAAMAGGFQVPRYWDLTDGSTSSDCKWSAVPDGHENYAVTCITWYGARAFCEFEGGDLPTEAQWEYAATGASTDAKTPYPWGFDPPQCSCDSGSAEPCHAPAFGLSDVNFPVKSLWCPGDGPLPVDARIGPNGDVTSLGITGLAGSASEMMRDSYQSYASDCWRAQPTRDPLCWEEEAPERTCRGSDFTGPAKYTLSSLRSVRAQASNTAPTTGFRCVYPVSSP